MKAGASNHCKKESGTAASTEGSLEKLIRSAFQLFPVNVDHVCKLDNWSIFAVPLSRAQLLLAVVLPRSQQQI